MSTDPTSVPRYIVTMDITQTPPVPVSYQREAHYTMQTPWGAYQDVTRLEDITADAFAEVFNNANITLSGQVQQLNAQIAAEREAAAVAQVSAVAAANAAWQARWDEMQAQIEPHPDLTQAAEQPNA